METHTLFELNEYLRRIVALNLPDAIWVKCEIAQLDFAKGHYFLDLIEKDDQDETIIARTNAVIWQRQIRLIQKKLGKNINEVLQEGLEVLIHAKVDYHERYGLKLIIEDIDPAFTIGKLELERTQTIQRLKSEGLFDLNAQLQLPIVLQNIAVLSSSTAAGLQDFLHQLGNNVYHYHFNTTLFDSTLQGPQAVPDLLHQLKKIIRQISKFDCLVIIRGGGARLDLVPFDDYKLCQALSQLPIPILTGIGHESDTTICDMIAHTRLKTPTAAADFLINNSVQFDQELAHAEESVANWIKERMYQEELFLLRMQDGLKQSLQFSLQTERNRLLQIETQLPFLYKNEMEKAKKELGYLINLHQLLDPQKTFARGYSITTNTKGEVISNTKDLEVGQEIKTQLLNGTIKSIIKK
ncbi:MAG: exodeoxyribonuclease VII large subunit [Bacteroidota bacterium]